MTRSLGARARSLLLTTTLLAAVACLHQDTNSGVILHPTVRATATPIAPGVYPVGGTVRRPNGNTVAVLEYAGPFPGAKSGVLVVAALIEGCADPTNTRPVRISITNIALEMSDQTKRPVVSGNRRSPAYTGKALKPRECERGWLHFEYRSDEKPTYVVYEVNPPIRWKVG
jgi:hypothetical protein